MMTRPPILSTDQPQEESVEQIMTGAPHYTAEQMDAMYEALDPDAEIAALRARVAELEAEAARLSAMLQAAQAEESE